MKTKHLLAFAAIILSTPLFGQANHNFTVRVVDATSSEPLTGANTLVYQDSSANFIFGKSSDSDGWLSLELPDGKYRLETSFVGYLSDKRTIQIDRTDTLTLSLTRTSAELDEVSLTDEIQRAEQNGDTVAYNADAYKTNPDANAQDLVEKMPGVVVKNGQVQAQGETVQKVLVDGKPFFGNDPNAALQNIPAEMVKKIEVFDQQSEQSQATGFDDGNTTKTMNIVTREGFRNGNFGNIYGGYGTDGRYQLGGVLNRFNEDQRITVVAQSNNINNQNFSEEDLAGVSSGGQRRGPPGGGARGGESSFTVPQQGGITNTNAIAINYTDDWGDKWESTMSYFFNRADNSNATDLRRIYVLPGDSGQIYEESSRSESTNINHRFNGRIEYGGRETKDFVLISPSITLQQNFGFSDLEGQTYTPETPINSTLNNFDSDYTAWSVNNFLLYRRRFEKLGRSLMISSRQQYKPTDGESFLETATNYELSNRSDSLDQRSTMDESDASWNVNIRYTEPIMGTSALLQFNARHSEEYGMSDTRTYNFMDLDDDYSELDTALSNVFDSRYVQDEVGGGIMLRGRRHFFITSLNYQWASMESEQTFPAVGRLDKNFTAFVPFAMWRYRKSRNNTLRVFYRANTSAPSVSQLQNVVDNSNPIQLSIGNPDLDQQYTHSLSARWNLNNPNKNRITYLLVRATAVNDYVGNSTIYASADTTLPGGIILDRGTQLTTAVNLDDRYTAKVLYTYGMPFKPLRSNLNWSIGADWAQTPGLIDGELNLARSTSAEFTLALSSNISERVDFTVTSITSFNDVQNTLNTGLNDQYWNQNTKARIYYQPADRLVFRTELSHQLYAGLTDGFDDQFMLWNASIGWKLFDQNQGELQLSMYDLLGQNTSISRTVSDAYYEDSTTEVLQTYVMLTFRYRIRDFNVDQ